METRIKTVKTTASALIIPEPYWFPYVARPSFSGDELADAFSAVSPEDIVEEKLFSATLVDSDVEPASFPAGFSHMRLLVAVARLSAR